MAKIKTNTKTYTVEEIQNHISNMRGILNNLSNDEDMFATVFYLALQNHMQTKDQITASVIRCVKNYIEMHNSFIDSSTEHAIRETLSKLNKNTINYNMERAYSLITGALENPNADTDYWKNIGTILTTDKLNSYLHEIDVSAKKMYDRLIKQMAEQEGVTEQLKAENQMEWVGRMNNIDNRAREIVNAEIIYTIA